MSVREVPGLSPYKKRVLQKVNRCIKKSLQWTIRLAGERNSLVSLAPQDFPLVLWNITFHS